MNAQRRNPNAGAQRRNPEADAPRLVRRRESRAVKARLQLKSHKSALWECVTRGDVEGAREQTAIRQPEEFHTNGHGWTILHEAVDRGHTGSRQRGLSSARVEA